MALIKTQEKFNIVSSFTLSIDDINCLTLLYLPIIKSDAYSLYMTLNSLLMHQSFKTSDMAHQVLFDILSFNPSKFEKERQILEAIGLLITYKDDEKYTYLLKCPVSAKVFFADIVLSSTLYSTVGEDLYIELRDKFVVPKLDKQHLTNISKQFNDVFDLNAKYKDKTDDYFINKKENELVIQNDKFDFSRFVNLIDIESIDGGLNDEFTKSIIDLSMVYNFTEEDVASILKETINQNGMYDLKLLKRKAKVLYNFKNKDKIPHLELKNKEINQGLDAISEATYEDVINAIFKERTQLKYINVLEDIVNKLDVEPTLAKIMVISVCKSLENNDPYFSLPPLSYFKKVKEDWILKEIFTKEEAYNQFILKQSKKKTVYKKKNSQPVETKYTKKRENKDEMEDAKRL